MMLASPIRSVRWVDIPVLAYILLLAIYLGGSAIFGDTWWLLAVFDWIAPYTLPVSVFILVYIFLRRRWLAACFLGVILLASFWNMRGLWSYGGHIADQSLSTLTIMTHNAGNGLAQPGDLVEVLRTSGADLIGLQEITKYQAQAIETGLAEIYPYRLLFGEGIPGKGLLSKYPITDHQRLQLYPNRPDLLATVSYYGMDLTVIVAHPPPPRIHSNGIYINKATKTQLERLYELATSGEPVVMLGDFNMTALSSLHFQLRSAGLIDAFQEAGEGPGFTLPKRWKKIPLLPLARVDFIWHTPHFSAHAAWLGEHSGSDHLPVLAKLSLEFTSFPNANFQNH